MRTPSMRRSSVSSSWAKRRDRASIAARRVTSIRGSFEFVSGETGFALDIMTNVEGLLNKALKQKKALNDRIASAGESMEKLFSEFNEIVRKGKTEFYRNL